jgi:aryl-alcohol dehydrogenase-like predicted oxidoreductase
MENRNRGRVSVPPVGLGTRRQLEAAAAAGRHRELTGAAIAAGIALFDTSPMYGEAERLLADALDGRALTSQAARPPAWRSGGATPHPHADVRTVHEAQ